MDSSTAVDLLLVEDDADDVRLIERLLVEHRRLLDDGGEGPGVEIGSVEHVERLADGLERVDAAGTDLVLLDLGLPDSDGIETVEAMVERVPAVPIVVLTGQTGAGVEAIRRGAQDYLVKGTITAELLVRTIRYAMERARVTRELRDRTHRLELANEILRTELRNDVSVIVGMSDQLRDRVGSDDRETVDALLAASRHALELADTAAELMDVLADEPTGDRTPVDLRAILGAELDAVRREYDVDLAVDWHVPEDEPLTVAGTPVLGSVFEHLLSNAATHTESDAPRVAVTVDATADSASVSIADEGVGIPDAQKELVVDPDGAREARSRLGAGLYFVTTVLESVGGDIEIEDNRPRGTVVTVRLDRITGQ